MFFKTWVKRGLGIMNEKRGRGRETVCWSVRDKGMEKRDNGYGGWRERLGKYFWRRLLSRRGRCREEYSVQSEKGVGSSGNIRKILRSERRVIRCFFFFLSFSLTIVLLPRFPPRRRSTTSFIRIVYVYARVTWRIKRSDYCIDIATIFPDNNGYFYAPLFQAFHFVGKFVHFFLNTILS